MTTARHKSYPTDFSQIAVRPEWSFADKTIKDTAYITHGIYTYPAKFVPQLASRLIQEHSRERDIIVDPFMGSGTTVLEAIIHHRIGIGTDINEIALLVAKVKTTPIDFDLLDHEFGKLMDRLAPMPIWDSGSGQVFADAKSWSHLPERIDFWFGEETKGKLIVILSNILKITHPDVRDFFLIVFAQILKSCSIWMQKSVKPTRDFKKKMVDPFAKFELQAKKALRQFRDFCYIAPECMKKDISQWRIVENQDARNIPCADEKASLIVTSPPYVTSYEYADLHQLSLLWFGHLNELSSFRRKFIGSAVRQREKIDLKSQLAGDIVSKLGDSKKNIEVENYFADMLESFVEMRRVLKPKGKVAIVIGNTKLKSVDISNAEVFQEQLKNIGFVTYDIIHRKIPSKMLPSIRDPKNGRFTKASSTKKLLAYPSEYILIMQKH